MHNQGSFRFTTSSIIYFLICTLALVPSLVEARPGRSRKARRQADSTTGPCVDLFDPEFDVFEAKEVYDCLITVPFNQTAALQFIDYYVDTIQLQSTLAYLKNPPEGYQQPAVDFAGSLELLKSEVNTGKFKNEYDFEVALQKLVIATHDAHVQLAYGILSIFVFGAPYGIGSASKDGVELPKIYIINDLIESSQNGATWQASPISTINGQETISYLEQFASDQVASLLEPHADYNALMSNPAGDIQSLYSVWEGQAPFYPGENITFNWENGTTSDFDDGEKLSWLAQFSSFVDPSSTPNITTGQQVFDYFILGIDSTPAGIAAAASLSASIAAEATATATGTATIDDSATATVTGDVGTATDDTSSTPTVEPNSLVWDNPAYPAADNIIAPPDLGTDDGSSITGYVLNDNVTGVLSIPSFQVTPDDANYFSAAVRDFLNMTQEFGCTRVIIDLQRNPGGSDLLATDTFKQFFPQLDPNQGARGRAESTGDGIGNTYSKFFQSKQPSEFTDPSYEQFAASVWTAPAAINVQTNANFTDWQQYFGPLTYNGDQFTRVRRDNLSSSVFTEQTAGIVVYGFANETVNTTQAYPAKDIILLTDAICSSACARFVELMRTVGGARTVVAGGRPETGPQQAVAGNKGALNYASFEIDLDIAAAQSLNSSLNTILPSDHGDLDFILPYASINLLDNIRPGLDIPLQFQYEAADCRIFYTTWTIYNFENLWNFVIDAIYRNPSLCVPGSTNVKSAPKPTPSTVGGLIMAGLSPSDPPSRGAPTKKKRSLPIQPLQPLLVAPRAPSPSIPESPSSDDLLTPRAQPLPVTPGIPFDRSDAPAVQDACARGCGPNFICFQSPKCLSGKLQNTPTCVQTCNQAAGINCRGAGQFCKSQPGKQGTCITLAQNQALKDCAAPSGTNGGGSNPQATKAANPAVKGLSFSRGSRQSSGSKAGGR